MYQTIINLMPPHTVYIEPFLGGGAILQRKRPAALTIGVDVDSDAIASFNEAELNAAKNAEACQYQFINRDGIEFLQSYSFTGQELVYCDPPYLSQTRRSARPMYRFDLSDDEHTTLLDILAALPCMVMISGYWSDLYASKLTAWHPTSFEAMTRGGTLATEWVWCNFPKPVALHDYRYLGKNYRERERIKRKTHRWMNRLQTMPTLERQALITALSSDLTSNDGVGQHRQK